MSATAWTDARLGEIAELKYGKSLPAKIRSGEGFPVFGSNGEVGRHRETVTSGTTIIVGRKGSFGEVTWSDEPCWPIDTTYYVDATSTDADLRWLYHRLQALPLKDLNRAAAIPGLNREDAYNLPVLVPPIEEQRRIAAVLDAVDELRAKRRETLARLETLTQAIFIDMFGDPAVNRRGWPVLTLGDVVAGFESGRSLAEDPDATGTGFRVLKVSSVTTWSYRPQESKPLPADYQPPSSHHVQAGDLLLSRANTSELVGATAYVYETPPRRVLSDKLLRFVWPDAPRAHPLYVWQALQDRRVRRQLSELASGSSGSMKNISQAKLQRVEMPMPPYELQRRFAGRLREVRACGELHTASSSRLDELFASLQQRAFRGEL